MSWEAFEVVFRLKSPLHIGYRQIGMLAKTRYYVPGRNMWAAVTARLAQMISGKDLPDYQGVGEMLKKNAKFSYFYFTEDFKNRQNDYLPRYTNEGLMWGALPQDEFERCFITSFTTTGIDHSSRTAEDESLHEIELLSHQTIVDKPENSMPVYLRGYIFLNNAVPEKPTLMGLELAKVLSSLQIGGEQRYGFGRLLLEDGNCSSVTCPVWAESFNKEKASIVLKGQRRYIPAHMAHGNIDVKGDIEMLRGREWDQRRGAGQHMPPSELCWKPGSCLMDKDQWGFSLNYDGTLIPL
ncbi:MAG: hypothetical protein DRH17_06570 [Deltaproteobacteria bacterium]|nr:MAG: hypothetical protein DRH17_06570 [Deltaproteobacteria bacterium]